MAREMPSRNLLHAVVFLLLRHVMLAGAAAGNPSANTSLTWGPYRPNLYFGVRPRTPQSLLMGLMWTRRENGRIVEEDLRHTCEQGDGMASYAWVNYDPRMGGLQTIHDPLNRLDVHTQLFKTSDGSHGGNWGVRITGLLNKGASADWPSTAVFYVGTEDTEHSSLTCSTEAGGVVECAGIDAELGGFQLQVQERPSKARYPSHTTLRHVSTSGGEIWDAKSIFLDQIRSGTEAPSNGNLHFIQKTFEGPFEFDVLFSSRIEAGNMTSYELTKGIRKSRDRFSQRFEEVFAPQRPYQYERLEFFKSLLSNLLGGIGYFYGDSKVDESHAPEYLETDPKFWEKAKEARARNQVKTKDPQELFSIVPSRATFPHGFLWDEGFHLLVVLEWDIDLAMEIIQSWLKLMDTDGWIAREQILGQEGRSKVSEEFQVQYPHHANPPTMFLVISNLIDILENKKPYKGRSSHYRDSSIAGMRMLAEVFPLLKRHYHWFRKSQAGDLESYTRPTHEPDEAYRWRGRTPQHCLTSGMDDHPRAHPPSPGELHVDALSWVGSMAGTLAKMAKFLGAEDEVEIFEKQHEAVKSNIESLHWSDERHAYCDATVDKNKHALVCRKGYVSLFPFLLGFIDLEHPHLGSVLDLLADEDQIWSGHGIRSLGQGDSAYHTGDDYWRGPVWVNINYMVIERLYELAQSPGEHQYRISRMYTSLRRNVVSTVYLSWSKTGSVWEQYNPEDGKGQRAQQFTGWTALAVKLAAMPDSAIPRSSLPKDDGWHVFDYRTVIAAFVLVVLPYVYRRRFVRLWNSIFRTKYRMHRRLS